MIKSKQFKHFILTRFNTQAFDGKLLYDNRKKADLWMKSRIERFKATRDSVLSQKGEFEWVIGLDSRTPEEMWPEISLNDDRITLFFGDVREYFDWHDHIYEPYVITTRLDNDDIYLPGAIQAIQDNFTHQEIIIDLRYFQKHGDDLYTSERPGPNSPFLSLIERTDKDHIRTCYARPHNKMSQDWPKAVFASRKELAYMVIHGDNAANKIVGRRV